MLKKISAGLLVSTITLFSLNAAADVVINGTCIIFNAKDNESTVQLKNRGNNPYLLQLWIDDGNPDARPGNSNVPFLIAPPVVRIDKDKGQAVRIMATNPALPQDRESLFWFNRLEIPPKPKAENTASTRMQLAFRPRIKLFYRPANLQPSPLQTYRDIKFVSDKGNIKVTNNSPYFITFKNIEVRRSGTKERLASVDNFSQRMIQPKQEITFPLAFKKPGSLSGTTVIYSVINDYGGETENEQALQERP